MKNLPTTDFGFQEVPVEEKAQRVQGVFDTVANRYDLMNDLMSFGLHRYWKKYTLEIAHIKPNDYILDIAGGTGDLARGFLKKLGPEGAVYLADINDAMLKTGRDKFINQGYFSNLHFIQTDAELLAFKDDCFDKAFMSFGLRNVTHKEKALASLYRALKPGGCLFILEFSTPILSLLRKAYDTYSFSFLPKLGGLVTGSEESYRYLVESIRKHPDQETLKQMILKSGFSQCEYFNLSGGIVCLHKAYKI